MFAMSKAYTSIRIALFTLLRSALGVAENVSVHLSPEEWKKLYILSKGQSVVGLVCVGINKLPKDQLPPRELLLRWVTCTEAIRGMNNVIYKEAARLTELFDKGGYRTAILKGAANARLYPDPGCRQCGDIDLWVEGGCEKVLEAVYQVGLLDRSVRPFITPYHIELPKNKRGIEVEAHFKPVAGVTAADCGLQDYLINEIKNVELVPEGFNVPSIKFALVMQLSHLQQHFLLGGLGLRQYADYFVLLLHSTENDRKEAAAAIKKFRMGYSCAAVMWLLGEVFGLERERMICPPSRFRGKMLLKYAFTGGDFGKYEIKSQNKVVHNIVDCLHRLSWLPFDPAKVLYTERWFWHVKLSAIRSRMKRRISKLRKVKNG